MKRVKNWANVEATDSEIYRAMIELDIAREEKEKAKLFQTDVEDSSINFETILFQM